MATKRKDTRRPKAGRTYLTDSHHNHPDWGEEYGYELTSLDKQRLRTIGRWYTLSLDHLTRLELDPVHWHPTQTDLPSGQVTGAYANKRRGIRRRIAKASRIQVNGTHAGPYVAAVRGWRTKAALHVTKYGANAIELPWDGKETINPNLIEHCWFAADIGMHIERSTGTRILSERELSSGMAVDWHDVGQRFGSPIDSHSGKTLTKTPDLVIPSKRRSKPDDYIAVEVERVTDRKISTYAEKLRAYRNNSRVSAIWFICGNDTTANRVGAAAEEVFGTTSKFPLRIRVADNHGGFYEVPNLARDVDLLHDLGAIGHQVYAAARAGLNAFTSPEAALTTLSAS